MKDLIEHIDALIMEYDCVIVPDFGGFVLNKESAQLGEVILPPSMTIGFNPALKHNDGLLAEAYMKSKSISYDAACKQISEAVKKTNGFLLAKQPVIFSKLGTFILNEESKLIFTPAKEGIKHPSTLGFSPVELRRLSEISRVNQTKIEEFKQFGIKRTVASVAATAAAVLFFFSISTPIKDVDQAQRSSFFTESSAINFRSVTPKVVETSNLDSIIEQKDTVNTEEKITGIEPAIATQLPAPSPEPKKQKTESRKSSVGYYIIVGSSPTENIAKKIVANLKNDGFSDALVVPSKTRRRIAVAQFEEKSSAERYLNNFRKKHPKYSDAWLLASH